jgi:hypothetical protein
MAYRTSLPLWFLTFLVVFYVAVRLALGVAELRSWSVGLSLSSHNRL